MELSTELDLSLVAVKGDRLREHGSRFAHALFTERKNYPESTALGPPEAFVLEDSSLVIAIPVYCCLKHVEEGAGPYSYIVLDKIESGLWKISAEAQA